MLRANGWSAALGVVTWGPWHQLIYTPRSFPHEGTALCPLSHGLLWLSLNLPWWSPTLARVGSFYCYLHGSSGDVPFGGSNYTTVRPFRWLVHSFGPPCLRCFLSLGEVVYLFIFSIYVWLLGHSDIATITSSQEPDWLWVFVVHLSLLKLPSMTDDSWRRQ